MTISEFKAWLEGFEAAIKGTPTAEQWEAIKAKIAQLQAFSDGPVYRSPSLPTPTWNIGSPSH